MIIFGTLGLGVIVIVALVLAGTTLYSCWRALRDELAMGNFRSQPPSIASLGLTLLGVVLPVVLIALFLLALAVVLFGMLPARF